MRELQYGAELLRTAPRRLAVGAVAVVSLVMLYYAIQDG